MWNTNFTLRLTRFADSTGVSDSIVNQLLSKIDGVDSLNNILIIGMTNRKDMIDEAILRPGRLEVSPAGIIFTLSITFDFVVDNLMWFLVDSY